MVTINIKNAVYNTSQGENVYESDQQRHLVVEGQQGILIGLQTLLYGEQYGELLEYAKSYLNPDYWQYIGMTQGTLYFPKGEYYLCGSHIYNKKVGENFEPQNYPYEILFKNQFAPNGTRNTTPSPVPGNTNGGYFENYPVFYLKIPEGISLRFDPGAVIYFGYVNAEQRARDVAARRYPDIGQFVVLDIQGEIEAGSHKIFDVWQTSHSVTFPGLNRDVAGGVSVFAWAAMSGMVIGPRRNKNLDPAWWGVSGYQEYAEVISIPEQFFYVDPLRRRTISYALGFLGASYFSYLQRFIYLLGINLVKHKIMPTNEYEQDVPSRLLIKNKYLYYENTMEKSSYTYYTKAGLFLQSCIDASWPGQTINIHGLQYFNSINLPPDRKYQGYGAYIKRPPTIDLGSYRVPGSWCDEGLNQGLEQ